MERGESLGVGLGEDADVAAALGVVVVTLLLQPVAQRHVLGVAKLRRGEGLAVQVVRGLDVVGDNQRRATRGGTGDDANGVTLRLRRRR